MHSPPTSQSPSRTPPLGGSELRALMRAVDQELSSLLGKLQAAVVALHAKHSGGGSGGNGAAASLGHGDDSEEVSGALRLLLVYAELSAGMGVLEAEIRVNVLSQSCKVLSAVSSMSISVSVSLLSANNRSTPSFELCCLLCMCMCMCN